MGEISCRRAPIQQTMIWMTLAFSHLGVIGLTADCVRDRPAILYTIYYAFFSLRPPLSIYNILYYLIYKKNIDAK